MKKSYDFPRSRPGIDRISMVVKPSNARARLDVFLTTAFEGYSRSFLQEFIRQGNVLVNSKTVRPSHRLAAGEEVTIILPEGAPMVPQEMPVEILFEDDCFVAVNKRAGVVMHPARGHLSDTLLNGLLYRYIDDIESEDFHLGALHRLDADTSGAVLWARDPAAHRYVAKQFEGRKVEKSYVAIVHGVPEEAEFEVDAALGIDPADRRKFAVDGVNAKHSLTAFEVIGSGEAGEPLTAVRARPHTGRGHQIRVHLAHAGHPVAGDILYGGSRQNAAGELIGRQALHSAMVGFTHPGSKEWMEIVAPLHEDMTLLLDRAGIKMPREREGQR